MTARSGYISIGVLLILLALAVLAPLLANDVPLHVRQGQNNYYPAWSIYFGRGGTHEIETPSGIKSVHYQRFDWTSEYWDAIRMPWIPFSPDGLGPSGSAYLAPGTDGHLLGTDRIGRDVAAGILHGARISLSIGWIAMGIAALLGVFLGGISGYSGNRGWSMPRVSFWVFWILLPLGWFYGMKANFGPPPADAVLFFGIPIGGAWLVGRHRAVRHKTIYVPLDSLITRLTEVLTSLPRLLIIITVASITSRSIWLVMVIIGLTSWTHIARYTRAEVLRIRSMEYITAAEATGIRAFRVLLRHALPNALAPVWVNMAFGIAAAILIESGLSFLGIGVPVETVTWGSMLNAGRMNVEAWWLMVFPGLAIFITVTSYNLLGEALRRWLQPKE